jgi:hypothetical protein
VDQEAPPVRTRRLWILAAVAAALAAAVGGVLLLANRPRRVPSGGEAARIELTTRAEADLARVSLADRREGPLVLEKKGEAWLAASAPGVALDPARARDFVYWFWSLSADRTVEENPADPGAYGLAPARARGEAFFADGSSLAYLLGDPTPAGDGYYMQVKGDPRVYKVGTAVGESMHVTLKDLRDRSISPAIVADEIVSARIRRPDGRVIEIVQKSPEEARDMQLGFGGYFLVRPWKIPRGLNAERQQAFLQGLLSLSIDDFVDDSPASLSPYGLASPWAEFSVKDKAGSTLAVQIGAARPDGMRCFRLAGRPAVYAVQEAKLAFLVQPVFDLAEKFVFIPSIDDVDALEITAGGRTRVYALSRQTKPAAEGEEPEVVASFTLDGKPLEDGQARKLYQRVIGLLVEGEAPRTTQGSRAEVRTRFRLNKGAAREVTVQYVDFDRDFYAVFVAGACDFLISKTQVGGMLSALEQAAEGKELAD